MDITGTMQDFYVDEFFAASAALSDSELDYLYNSGTGRSYAQLAAEAAALAIDGGEGGSGAAPQTLMDHMALPIAEALRVYSAEMRDKRVMRAEEKANTLPTKLTLGTMMFTLPPLLIILIGPSVHGIATTLSMGAGP